MRTLARTGALQKGKSEDCECQMDIPLYLHLHTVKMSLKDLFREVCCLKPLRQSQLSTLTYAVPVNCIKVGLNKHASN